MYIQNFRTLILNFGIYIQKFRTKIFDAIIRIFKHPAKSFSERRKIYREKALTAAQQVFIKICAKHLFNINNIHIFAL